MVAERNPQLSVQAVTMDYYARMFSASILPRLCFSFWDVQRDAELEHVPETIRMGLFVQRAYECNYEDDIKSKFIYE